MCLVPECNVETAGFTGKGARVAVLLDERELLDTSRVVMELLTFSRSTTCSLSVYRITSVSDLMA